MESKKQLLECVSQIGCHRKKYLLDLFKYIPEAIAKEMIYTVVKKDEYIVLAGDASDTVFFILQGHVVGLDYQKMGRVYSFMDFTDMYVIGDFEIFGKYSEYWVTVRATEDCKLLKVSSQSYLNWIQHDENALLLRLNNITNMLIFERQIDRDFLLMNCKERLASFLSKYYEKGIKDTSGKIKVSNTQDVLSKKIGYNIRSVQRGIASLEKENLVSIENGKITISYEQYLELNQYIDKKERK